MAYVPVADSTLSAMGAIALRKQAWDNKLRKEAVLNTVFAKLTQDVTGAPAGGVGGGAISVPSNAIGLRINSGESNESYSTTLAVKMAYRDAPREGTSENMLGYEETHRLKHSTLYYNELKKSVASWRWGMEANTEKYLNILATIHPDMAKYFAELEDRRIMEAMLLWCSNELTKAPVSITQMYNPNMYILNTLYGNMPAYDLTALTVSVDNAYPYNDTLIGDYTEIIGDALYAACNSGANPEYMNFYRHNDMLALEYYCRVNLRLNTFKVSGRDTLLFFIPSDNAVQFRDIGKSGSFAANFIPAQNLSSDELKYDGVLGRFGCFLVIENDRAPTVTLGGANGAWTLQPGFMQPGNYDGRNGTAWSNTSGDLNYVFNVGYVCGRESYGIYEPTPLAYNIELTEYGKIQGDGAQRLSGVKLIVYDEDSPSNTTFYQHGCCAVLMSKPDIVNVT